MAGGFADVMADRHIADLVKHSTDRLQAVDGSSFLTFLDAVWSSSHTEGITEAQAKRLGAGARLNPFAGWPGPS